MSSAYDAAGRFNDAARITKQAIDTAKASYQKDLFSEIGNRMELSAVSSEIVVGARDYI